jgi:hypothetical protein
MSLLLTDNVWKWSTEFVVISPFLVNVGLLFSVMQWKCALTWWEHTCPGSQTFSTECIVLFLVWQNHFAVTTRQRVS